MLSCAAVENHWFGGLAEGLGMFEFHGWATIRVPDPERTDFKPIGRGTEVEAIKRVRAAINDAHDEFSFSTCDRRATT